MANHRTSYHSQHPAGLPAVAAPDVEQVPVVWPPGVGPAQKDLRGTSAGPPAVHEPGTPPLQMAEGDVHRTAQVSLLAATALGLAFATGPTDGNVRALARLGAPDADILLEASAAVLELEVGPRRARVLAAHLLGRAAVVCP